MNENAYVCVSVCVIVCVIVCMYMYVCISICVCICVCLPAWRTALKWSLPIMCATVAIESVVCPKVKQINK